jgi:acyl-coenzyme A synthetase/AMP-(fatty) acid ligase/3-hydroxymyristoyl/3-hydroxydecanoyl-(acyl carrier protein) dehydratase
VNGLFAAGSSGNDMSGLIPLSRWLLEQPAGSVAADRGVEVDARDFAARVQAWMAALAGQPGARWAVYHQNSIEFLAILQALWQLGRSACVCGDNRAGTVIRLAAGVDGFCGEFPGAVSVIAEPENRTPPFQPWVVPKPGLVAVELFTSGSSGEPKSICKTIAQLEREIEMLEAMWPSRSGSAVLATVSHQHFYGMIFALLWPFSSGRCFESRVCEYPEDIIHRAAQYSSFVLISSPSHLGRFNPLLDWKAVAPRCDYVVSSAAPLSREDSVAVGGLLDTQVREIYGSTETGAVAWRCQQLGDADVPWTALPGIVLAPATDGGLSVRSPCLGDIDELVLPDRVEFNDRGGFRLCGRMDRIVKVEGKRVSLDLIEGLLQDHAWVKAVRALTIIRARIETAIVMQLNDAGNEQLRRSGRKAIIDSFKDILVRDLEAIVLPRRWRFVEQMPFNQQGKLPLENLQVLFEKEVIKWPQIIDQQLVDRQLTLRCRIPAELIYFDGHMDSQPLLPGIVQIHWAEFYGRQLLPVSGRFERLEVVKFIRIVLPLDQVTINLSFNEVNGKLSFSYESDRGVHSSGRICFTQ